MQAFGLYERSSNKGALLYPQALNVRTPFWGFAPIVSPSDAASRLTARRCLPWPILPSDIALRRS